MRRRPKRRLVGKEARNPPSFYDPLAHKQESTAVLKSRGDFLKFQEAPPEVMSDFNTAKQLAVKAALAQKYRPKLFEKILVDSIMQSITPEHRGRVGALYLRHGFPALAAINDYGKPALDAIRKHGAYSLKAIKTAVRMNVPEERAWIVLSSNRGEAFAKDTKSNVNAVKTAVGLGMPEENAWRTLMGNRSEAFVKEMNRRSGIMYRLLSKRKRRLP